MAIDGEPVSEDGEVTFRGHERVEFEYLITSKACGESVKLLLLRGEHGASTASGKLDLTKLFSQPRAHWMHQDPPPPNPPKPPQPALPPPLL